MSDHSKDQDSQRDLEPEIGSLKTRDEILQVMYWMTGEGLGSEFTIAALQKFLHAEQAVLIDDLDLMVSSGLLARVEDYKFALTEQGRSEGGRRFADEFESMIKPGHFECDEPDCDCHSPESFGEPCRNLTGTDLHPA